MDSILIVEPDQSYRESLESSLRQEGYNLESVASSEQAFEAARRRNFSIVVLSLAALNGDSTGPIRWFRDNATETPIIAITPQEDAHTSVEVMKEGAVCCITRPTPDELRLLIRRELRESETRHQCELLHQQEAGRFDCGDLVTEDPSMAEAVDLIRRAAGTNSTVLIVGEMGVGKESLARCIHLNSSRAQKIFVPVNPAAFTGSADHELFGHQNGGSPANRIGRFERAHGGTLYFGEIAELDPASQDKLVQVLQNGSYERDGKHIDVDIRVIAGTSRDLRRLAADGRFREDLLRHISTFTIEVPPLRQRKSDIPKLARRFLAQAGVEFGKPVLNLTMEAEQALSEYDWPGNVWELKNIMERASLLGDREVRREHLPMGTNAGPAQQQRPKLFKDIERLAIMEALEENRGNRTRTAAQLGISLRTLQYRLKEYGVTRGEIAPPAPDRTI